MPFGIWDDTVFNLSITQVSLPYFIVRCTKLSYLLKQSELCFNYTVHRQPSFATFLKHCKILVSSQPFTCTILTEKNLFSFHYIVLHNSRYSISKLHLRFFLVQLLVKGHLEKKKSNAIVASLFLTVFFC